MRHSRLAIAAAPSPCSCRIAAGIDIAGTANIGYVAGTSAGRDDAQLYRVDLTTGETRRLGRIGRGSVAITGLAAWQDS